MRSNFLFRQSPWLAALAGVVSLVGPVAADESAKPAKKPQVEVVFCLDTTGSMGGLIEGAKQKIWAICNQIASGKPTPGPQGRPGRLSRQGRRIHHQGHSTCRTTSTPFTAI